MPSGRKLTTQRTREIAGSPASPVRLTESVVLPNNVVHKVTWDAVSRTIKSESAERRVVTDVLDARGRLERRDVSGLASTHYFYDSVGRLDHVRVGAEGPGSRTVQYGYAADGRLETVTDALGRTTRFVRDDERGLTTQVLAPSQTPAMKWNLNGELERLSTSAGYAYDFGYSAAGLWTDTIAPDESVERRVLNADRSVQQVVRADGSVVRFSYDQGLPTHVHLARGDIVTYDHDGDLRADRLTAPSWASTGTARCCRR